MSLSWIIPILFAVAICVLAYVYVLPKIRRMVFNPPNGDYRPFAFSFLNGAFVFMAVVFATAVLFRFNDKDFGTFGDFFGGVVNPVLTFLTFVGLLITIVVQQDATRQARRDSYRQMFDSTFFQMLTLLNTMVNELEVRDTEGTIRAKGKRSFQYAYDAMRGYYMSGPSSSPEIRKIGSAWSSIYSVSDFPHYFRFVYNVIRTIDEAKLTPDTKKEYVRLLRAQLSNHETGIIFYNAMTSYGADFKPLIEKYELMDNFPDRLYLSARHKQLFKTASFDMSELETGHF